MRKYKKEPLTYTEQIKLLQKRGLIVNDISRVERYLGEISYYRLSGYFLPLCESKDKFVEGTTFDDILSLYLFDRDLRLIVFDAIERVEVAIRTQIIYKLSHKYNDSHWQDNAAIFKPSHTNSRTGKTYYVYQDIQDLIQKQKTAKHPEVFIKHYISKYNDPPNPPCWMSIELLTIGELSRLYTALKNNSDKKNIAEFFGLHHTVFESWFHTLAYVRNICAHHARLWNRELAIKPMVLIKPKYKWIDKAFNRNNHRCFYFLSVMKYLLINANPSNHLKERLVGLFEKYPDVPTKYMGIPTNRSSKLIDWQLQPIWQ